MTTQPPRIEPYEATYLGDGAYAEYTGFSIVVFTTNGITRTNEVHLEAPHLKNLIEFAKMMRMVK